VKPIDEYVGKRPGSITTTCLRCREQIDGAKAQGMRLRAALRELFAEAVEVTA
jgi:hypothetical protein